MAWEPPPTPPLICKGGEIITARIQCKRLPWHKDTKTDWDVTSICYYRTIGGFTLWHTLNGAPVVVALFQIGTKYSFIK